EVTEALWDEREARDPDPVETGEQLGRQLAAGNLRRKFVRVDEERGIQGAKCRHALGVPGARRDHPHVQAAGDHHASDRLVPVWLAVLAVCVPDGLDEELTP